MPLGLGTIRFPVRRPAQSAAYLHGATCGHILIASPTIEICALYQIPARRSFIVRALSRITENISTRHFVGIVDCKHALPSDPALWKQANHWAAEFAKHDRLPQFFSAPGRHPNACFKGVSCPGLFRLAHIIPMRA